MNLVASQEREVGALTEARKELIAFLKNFEINAPTKKETPYNSVLVVPAYAPYFVHQLLSKNIAVTLRQYDARTVVYKGGATAEELKTLFSDCFNLAEYKKEDLVASSSTSQVSVTRPKKRRVVDTDEGEVADTPDEKKQRTEDEEVPLPPAPPAPPAPPLPDNDLPSTVSVAAPNVEDGVELVRSIRIDHYYYDICTYITRLSTDLFNDMDHIRIIWNLKEWNSSDSSEIPREKLVRIIHQVKELVEIVQLNENGVILQFTDQDFGRLHLFKKLDSALKSLGNPFKVIKGDGFCVYRCAAILQELESSNDTNLPGRGDIDLKDTGDQQLFLSVVRKVYNVAQAEIDKAQKAMATFLEENPTTEEEEEEQPEKRKERLILQGDINIRNTHFLRFEEAQRLAQVFEASEGKKNVLPSLNSQFWPEEEVFSYSGLQRPLVMYERNKTTTTNTWPQPKMWYQAAQILINGDVFERTSSRVDEESNDLVSNLRVGVCLNTIMKVIHTRNNTIYTGRNHYDLYIKSVTDMESDATCVLKTVERFAKALVENRREIMDLVRKFVVFMIGVMKDSQLESMNEYNILSQLFSKHWSNLATPPPTSIIDTSFSDAQKKFTDDSDLRPLFQYPPAKLVSDILIFLILIFCIVNGCMVVQFR